MCNINNAEFKARYKIYYEKFNVIFIDLRDNRINLIEDKNTNVSNFYENMHKKYSIKF